MGSAAKRDNKKESFAPPARRDTEEVEHILRLSAKASDDRESAALFEALWDLDRVALCFCFEDLEGFCLVRYLQKKT